MKRYKITIPAFSLEVEPKSKKEALEWFWSDCGKATLNGDFEQPIIELVRPESKKQQRKSGKD